MQVPTAKELFDDFVSDLIATANDQFIGVEELHALFTQVYCVFHEVSTAQFNTWMYEAGHDITVACCSMTNQPKAYWQDVKLKPIPRRIHIARNGAGEPAKKRLAMRRQGRAK